MTHHRVTRRYAQALYDEAGGDPRVTADLHEVRAVLQQEPQLLPSLQSPLTGRSQKEHLIEATFPQDMQPLSRRFFRLLVSRGRIALLEDMLNAYDACCDASTGTVTAHVRAGAELSASECKGLAAALENCTDGPVRLQMERDQSLIGGLVVRIGDVVYDGSICHQLTKLRSCLAGVIHSQ